MLNQSHESLRKLGVSLPEIDELVHELQSTEGVLGARLMGGIWRHDYRLGNR